MMRKAKLIFPTMSKAAHGHAAQPHLFFMTAAPPIFLESRKLWLTCTPNAR